ncbi:MAG: type VI secretion system tip protein VgrG [Deltaproteobacteria bacterium]|jgi:type VI secretion system VgrG family protein|nr:type VI secretion system tip protein VgrG [Deltaproteobacteria bacterium]
MANFSRAVFDFSFLAFKDIKAQVIKFQGWSGLNELYNIQVTLLAPSKDLEEAQWEDFFATPCSLTISDGSPQSDEEGAQAGYTVWTGLINKMSTGSQLDAFTYLEVEMIPYIGLLRGQVQNRIHLDHNCLGILKDSFKFGGLEADRVKIKAQGQDYPQRDFVFQYEEDLLDFVWRTLSHDGLTLSYEQTPNGEIAVITDNNVQFKPLLYGDKEIVLRNAAVSGLALSPGETPAYNFRAESAFPPKNLVLDDYNWEDPYRPLHVDVTVSSKGRGEVHLYGENFSTSAEGIRLAYLRKEEILANCGRYYLSTPVFGIKPGLTFSLEKHPWKGFNDRYLTVRTEFSGSQSGALSSRLGIDLGHEDLSFVHNVVCQKLSVPYRPRRVVKRKKISGSVTAWIDGAGSGATPEIDGCGRYKIALPMDFSGRSDGKASAWVRMAQPYVGRGYGMNFPLTPGTEVLLTFVDGNPDRPVISGAVANKETNNVVNSTTNAMAGFGTKGGGTLMFNEQPGKQKVMLSSGCNRGKISLSANSPTNALIEADKVNLLAMNMGDMTAIKKEAKVGSIYAVTVSNTKLIAFYTILQTIIDAATVATDMASFGTEYRGDDSVDRPSVIAQQAAAGMSVSMDLVSKMVDIYDAYNDLRRAPIGPHPPLIELTVADDEVKNTMRAIKTSELTVTSICLLLGSLTAAAEDAEKIWQNLDDEDKAREGTDDYDPEKGGDGPATVRALRIKKASEGINGGSFCVDVIAQIITDVTMLYTLKSVFKPPQGILITNEHSYVAVRSAKHASVSSDGPLILESHSGSLGDMLRFAISEDTAASNSKKMLTPDILEPDWETNLEEAKVVLLRGDMVRSVADEVSQVASGSIVNKARNSIQLIAGLGAVEGRIYDTVYKTAKKALETTAETKEGLPEEAPIEAKDIALGAVFTAMGVLLNECMPQIPVEDEMKDNGILLRTLNDGVGHGDIAINAVGQESEIRLVQGDANIKSDSAPSILLSGLYASIQVAEKTSVLLSKGGGVSITGDQDAVVSVGRKKINLTVEQGGSIKIGANAVDIESQGAMSLKSAMGSINLSQADMTLDFSGVSVSLKQVGVMLR